MGRKLLGRAPAVVVLSGLPIMLFASQHRASADDALVDVLVWGAGLPIDPSAYPTAVKAELTAYLRRSKAYRPKVSRVPESGEMSMITSTRVRYERKLAAVSDDPQAPALAAAYVEALKPCYEWEGYHDCPEREALFADKYRAAHPDGPFREYLALLAAHRWLCAAEFYEFEQKPDQAERSRRAYAEALSTAERSSNLLIRSSAGSLFSRGSCYSSR